MITDLVESDLRGEFRGEMRELRPVIRETEDAERRRRVRCATLSTIVGIEALVFLAILYTLSRGPIDLRPSTWALAGLSTLFLVLSQLRRRAAADAAND